MRSRKREKTGEEGWDMATWRAQIRGRKERERWGLGAFFSSDWRLLLKFVFLAPSFPKLENGSQI